MEFILINTFMKTKHIYIYPYHKHGEKEWFQKHFFFKREKL